MLTTIEEGLLPQEAVGAVLPYIVVGVDTHKDTHTAAALDEVLPGAMLLNNAWEIMKWGYSTTSQAPRIC